MRKPIKISKKHGWGKRKIRLTKSGQFISRIRPGKRARTNLSMDKKKKKVGYKPNYI